MSAVDTQRSRLVLCRFAGQRIVIGGDIVVELVAMEGKQVRLLFDAPRTASIVREELIPKKHRLGFPKPWPPAAPPRNPVASRATQKPSEKPATSNLEVTRLKR